MPGSALRYSGSVATSVLPSPVAISAMRPAVQLDAADELHIVGHHVPFHRRARSPSTVVPDEPAAGLAHGGERLGQQIVEHVASRLAQFLSTPPLPSAPCELGVDALALAGVGRRCAWPPAARRPGPRSAPVRSRDRRPELRRLPLQLGLGEAFEPLRLLVDAVDRAAGCARRSRSCRVPKTLLISLLSIAFLFLMSLPVTGTARRARCRPARPPARTRESTARRAPAPGSRSTTHPPAAMRGRDTAGNRPASSRGSHPANDPVDIAAPPE